MTTGVGPAEHGPDTGQEIFCGVDVGASATKLVLLDSEEKVLARVVRFSGVDYAATARECLSAAMAKVGVACMASATDFDAVCNGGSDTALTYSVATGYGRSNVDFANKALTEIHCHGLGAYHHFQHAITIIDIGGQDNKVIRLQENGQRADFRMNRKCAAGTGAFLEEIALRLNLKMEEMDPLARKAADAVKLSSFCTVFAKTEILAHLRQGVPVERIVRGAFHSVITRVLEMAPLDGDVVLTGGVVAYNPSIAEILAEKLGQAVDVPPHPQFAGALGAALAAKRQAL